MLFTKHSVSLLKGAAFKRVFINYEFSRIIIFMYFPISTCIRKSYKYMKSLIKVIKSLNLILHNFATLTPERADRFLAWLEFEVLNRKA